jgi:hypothetical protein
MRKGRRGVECVGRGGKKTIESFTSEMLFIAGGRLGVVGARRNEFPVEKGKGPTISTEEDQQ